MVDAGNAHHHVVQQRKARAQRFARGRRLHGGIRAAAQTEDLAREFRARAGPFAGGVVQPVFTRPDQAFDEAGERVRRGRGGNLVLGQAHGFPARRRLQHLVDEIVRPRAVQPGGTHDHMLIRQLAHQLFPSVLAFAVHGRRMRVVEFAQRGRARAVENVVG